MECILRGDMSITDNFEFIRDIALSSPSNQVKIINLEEVPSLDNDKLPNVIGGTIILPPIEALMAAANGDEQMFDQAYVEHLNTPVVVEFIDLLITALYKGTNLILFYPEDDLHLRGKILDIFWKRFGIMIGTVGQCQCQYDISCTPIWLEGIYDIGAISPYELLSMYPEEAMIQDRLIYKLIIAINPVGKSYQDKADYIISLKQKMKEKPNLIIPFRECTL